MPKCQWNNYYIDFTSNVHFAHLHTPTLLTLRTNCMFDIFHLLLLHFFFDSLFWLISFARLLWLFIAPSVNIIGLLLKIKRLRNAKICFQLTVQGSVSVCISLFFSFFFCLLHIGDAEVSRFRLTLIGIFSFTPISILVSPSIVTMLDFSVCIAIAYID